MNVELTTILIKTGAALLILTVLETRVNCLSGRIAALRGARNLNIFLYMSRFLGSVRLAIHPAQIINQGFLFFINV